jgi:hypothetical protein
MGKAEVSVDYSNNKYTDDELFTECSSVHLKMSSNSNFPTPVPALTVLATGIKAFSDAKIDAAGGSTTLTALKNEKRELLEALMGEMGIYVQAASGGVASIILGSGMHVNKTPGFIGELAIVTGFNLKTNDIKNRMVGSCDAMPNATFYELSYTPAPATSDSIWQTKTSTKSTVTINGLPSYIPYVFKMCAAGTDDSRNFTDGITRAAE